MASQLDRHIDFLAFVRGNDFEFKSCKTQKNGIVGAWDLASGFLGARVKTKTKRAFLRHPESGLSLMTRQRHRGRGAEVRPKRPLDKFELYS